MILQIRDKSELELELEQAGDKLVLVDFYATWCGPCRKIAPVVEKIATEHASEVLLLKVDIDEVEEVVGEYAVEVMPTFVFQRNGVKLDTLVGSNEHKLRQLIERHLEERQQ